METLRYPWERLEQLIGDRMGTDFGPLGALPNDQVPNDSSPQYNGDGSGADLEPRSLETQ